jgi:hypothetical protein
MFVRTLAIHKDYTQRVPDVYPRDSTLDGEWRDVLLVARLLGDAARG